MKNCEKVKEFNEGFKLRRKKEETPPPLIPGSKPPIQSPRHTIKYNTNSSQLHQIKNPGQILS